MNLSVISFVFFLMSVVTQAINEQDYRETCPRFLDDCFVDLASRYNRRKHDESISEIHSTGPRELCKEVSKARQCAEEKLNSRGCQNIPQSYQALGREILSFSDYVCEKKLDDIEEHWDCFFDSEFQSVMLNSCQPYSEGVHDVDICDFSWFLDCVTRAVSAAPSCKPEAEELASVLARKAVEIPYAQHCTDWGKNR